MPSKIPDHLLSEKQFKKRKYNLSHREKLTREKSEKSRKNKGEKKQANHLKEKKKETSEKPKSEKTRKNNLFLIMSNKKSTFKEKKMATNLKSISSERKKDISWQELQARAMLPKNGIFLFLLLTLSFFLIWQGALFLMKQGYSLEESYVCSIFGELLLVVSAGLIFQAETPGAKKAFKFICGLSIFLLGAFLHNGVKSSLLEANPEYQRTQREYDLLASDIKTLKEDKKNLPTSYKTKKNEIQNKVDEKIVQMKAYSEQLKIFESKTIGIGQYYIAWIRIALMLINAYLAHTFLKNLLF